MLGRRRNRGRSGKRLRVFFVLFVLIGGAGTLYAIGRAAYLTGETLAAWQVRSLEAERDKLTATLAATQAQRDTLQSRLNEANDSLAAMKRRYERDVPAGAAAELYGLLRDRMAAGLTIDRLRTAIQGAEPVRACEGRSVRKRIAVQPAAAKPVEPVLFLDGLVGVTATATGSATGASDNSVQSASVSLYAAWMDKPVVLGALPVKHDVLLNNTTLRLVVEPGDLRGYVNATLSSCVAKAS
ncbi:MAG: hypothetical protein U1E70_06765 [Acetobacteraceae bacterium]|nr:hypothetical protein [Pseudomonadota bacterium]